MVEVNTSADCYSTVGAIPPARRTKAGARQTLGDFAAPSARESDVERWGRVRGALRASRRSIRLVTKSAVFIRQAILSDAFKADDDEAVDGHEDELPECEPDDGS